MKLDNLYSMFDKKELFYCYSLNLNNFLQLHKHIIPLNCDINNSTGKKFFVFLRTDELNLCLAEWSSRKVCGDYYFQKDVWC